MALSGTGMELWPPLLRTSRRRSRYPLLGSLNIVRDTLAVHHLAFAAFIEAEFGIDQFAMILEQPVDAVVRPAAFFVGGERHDDVAIGFVALALVANQIGNPDGRLRFVVCGAAAVVVAVLFGERERIQAPVFALGFDDIGVRQQQNRFELAGSVIAHNQIGLGGDRAADEDVGIRKSGRAQVSRDGFRHGRSGPGRITGLDFDDLTIDIVREALVGLGRQVGSGEAEERSKSKRKATKHAAHYDMWGRSGPFEQV